MSPAFLPDASKMAASMAFIVRFLALMDPQSVKLVFQNQTEVEATVLFTQLFAAGSTLRTWQLFNLDHRSANETLDHTSPKSLLVIYVLHHPKDFAVPRRLIYLNTARSVRHLVVVENLDFNVFQWNKARHASQCIIMEPHPEFGNFSLHMWEWHLMLGFQENFLWTNTYPRQKLYRNLSMTLAEIPHIFSSLLVQLTPWPSHSYVVNSPPGSDAAPHVAGFQIEVAKLLENALRPYYPLEFVIPETNWRNISWPWTPYNAGDLSKYEFSVFDKWALLEKVRKNYIQPKRPHKSSPLYLVFAEQHNGFHSLPYASETYMVVVPHQLVFCERKYTSVFLNVLWFVISVIIGFIRKIVQQFGIGSRQSVATIVLDGFGRFYGIPVRHNCVTNRADDCMRACMTICGMLATMGLTNLFLSQFLDDEMCQRYRRIEDMREGQLEVHVGKAFPEQIFSQLANDYGLQMRRNRRPEVDLFDGPVRQNRAYFLPSGQSGILYSQAWPDRNKYFVLREKLLAERVRCQHHIEVHPWFMVTHVDRALRRLEEAGLLIYQQLRSWDTFILLLYKELRDADGEYESSQPNISWAPIGLSDATISRLFVFSSIFYIGAFAVLIGEVLSNWIRNRRANSANRCNYAANRRLNRCRIAIKKKGRNYLNSNKRNGRELNLRKVMILNPQENTIWFTSHTNMVLPQKRHH